MKNIYKNTNLGSMPKINISVRRVEASTWYSLGFYKHHYMNKKINPSCVCLLFKWNNEDIAFVGIINQPAKDRPHSKSISRFVILPDFQGLGLAKMIINFVGGIINNISEDTNLYIKTAHDKMGTMLEHNNRWVPTTYNKKKRLNINVKDGRFKNALERFSYCYKYIGENIKGYEDLLLPIEEMREYHIQRIQLNLFY